jgi:formamidopyrimidine-DNA glycosylase
MPELPEVETIRRGLVERLIGDEIIEVTINVPKMFRGDPNNILHTKIIDVRRIAKVMVIDFANANSLLVHFKMTGQLVYVKNKDIAVGGHPEKAYQNPLPHKHTHITYHLSDKGVLYYNDLRKFGWHKVVKTADVTAAIGKELAGVDVLSPDFTLAYFESFIKQRPNRPIKEAIMEQRYIAGIGNIYAAEALWQAKVRPDRTAKSLNKNEISAVYEGIKEVIDLSLKYGGSSFNSYIDAAGKQGAYLKFANVYKKEKDSLGHEIERIKQGGRTTHFCPICQL